MADTRPRPEIEDVLASIRRLVSQDSPRVAESYPTSRGEGSTPDPLVLTPAHLVSDTQAESKGDIHDLEWSAPGVSPEEEAAEAQDDAVELSEAPTESVEPATLSEARRKPQNFEPEFDDAEAEPWPSEAELPQGSFDDELKRLEGSLAQLEAEVARDGADYESETGDAFEPAGTAPLTELPESFTPVWDQGSDPEQTFTSAEWEDVAGFVAPHAPEANEAEDDTDIASETLESVGDDPLAGLDFDDAAPAEVEPEDISAEEETFGTEAVIGFDVPPGAEAEPEPASLQDATAAQDWEDLTPEMDGADSASEFVQASEHAADTPPRRLHLSDAGARAPEPEPRTSSYAELRASLEEDFEADEIAALEAELASTSDQPDAALHPLAQSMTETQLRHLVSSLLREELQGALGAKITRNLRKMVRREVQRALMSRDLD
ncbi:hypothetical protein [Thioclava electrotropha]|uniref:Glycerol-3-phosphate dehydrogenase n=1 Tax=Thioclava electrotropha TaxID=1549850 RepID=A0ABX6YXD9_9RHOB|nr:hypothetical protein [Thioclava electrotropha]QPZ92516.1 hypothetical protein AKL02_017540 [Thioclava electrotropha]